MILPWLRRALIQKAPAFIPPIAIQLPDDGDDKGAGKRAPFSDASSADDADFAVGVSSAVRSRRNWEQVRTNSPRARARAVNEVNSVSCVVRVQLPIESTVENPPRAR